MRRTLEQIIDHMLEDCNDIGDFVVRAASIEGMDNDKALRKAIVFSILNLGELAKLLETRVDISYSGIDWKGLKGMRDIAAHRYQSMESIIIWDVATETVPTIKKFLSLKLAEIPETQLKQQVRPKD